jgi:lactate dehydrogenase-like 2-hydroxyacid dehydrogenase
MKIRPVTSILIVDGVRVADSDLLAPLAHELDLRLTTAVGRDPSELPLLAKEADVLLVKTATIGRDLLQTCPRLHLIYKTGVLCDNIDSAAASQMGIPIATMPIPSAVAVAEHTFCLLLAVARHLLQAHRAVLDGKRPPGMQPQATSELAFAYNWAGLPPSMLLYGKTLGLVGMGEIGTQVARRAAAFGMTVNYHKRTPLTKEQEQQFNVAYRPLEDMLREADVISLHLPHTAASDKLLSRERLKLLKKTAIVINTARGGLVDENALTEALSLHALAGAGLDVFESEPLPLDSSLLQLDNVVLTPHIAGAGMDAWRDTLRNILRDIASRM